MLRRFAVELLNEVADECESRACSNTNCRGLFANAAEKITDIVEILSVEPVEESD